MKKLILLLAVGAISLTATAQNIDLGRKFETQTDSATYALGMYVGHNLLGELQKEFGGDFSKEIFREGIIMGLKEDFEFSEEAVFEYLQYYMSEVLPAKKKAEGDAYLAEIEQQRGVQRSSTGLLYRIDKIGNRTRATSDSSVEVKYKGTKINGDIFEDNDGATFELDNVIDGFAEGMKLIGEGGKITLWIPAELGYGNTGGPDPGMPLIFEVEIIKID